jgi:hypothetical protein
MSPAQSAAARRLRVVDEVARQQQNRMPPGTPLVGYLVLVPEGTDPGSLFTADGTRVEFLPLPREGGGLTAPQAPVSPAASVSPAPPAAPAGPEARRGIRVDVERHTAEADGKSLDLTYLEFELLAHLAAHPYRVHTRDHLVGTLWGYSHVGDGRTVDVHIARLRRKLGPDYRKRIVTVRRVGYKYVPGPAS